MKELKTTILLFCISVFSGIAQDITGDWYGTLKEFQLQIVFHIEKGENGFIATMDSPNQDTFGIKVNSVNFENGELQLAIPMGGIAYKGIVKSSESIEGTFSQGGMNLSLNLSRNADVEKTSRPQEPKKPYPYHSEDVFFENAQAGIKLAGTFTYPKAEGKYPVVVLISGSGAQNRDEEIMGHKPFLVLADYLTRHNIAVLRFDDRGTAESTGNFEGATSMDFATDVEAAVKYLHSRTEIDKNKIGLIGHSEGGIIAPIVASRNDNIAFIVLMAGTGLTGGEILLLQQELIGRASGMTEPMIKRTKELNQKALEIICKNKDVEQIRKELRVFLEKSLTEEDLAAFPKELDKKAIVEMQIQQTTNPWMLHFIKFDPKTVLEKVKCPVLAINGEKDLQVPPKENLSAIESALKKGGNQSVTILELPGLNHLFQEAETGAPSEYGLIEQTISPKVLELISNWINNLK